MLELKDLRNINKLLEIAEQNKLTQAVVSLQAITGRWAGISKSIRNTVEHELRHERNPDILEKLLAIPRQLREVDIRINRKLTNPFELSLEHDIQSKIVSNAYTLEQRDRAINGATDMAVTMMRDFPTYECSYIASSGLLCKITEDRDMLVSAMQALNKAILIEDEQPSGQGKKDFLLDRKVDILLKMGDAESLNSALEIIESFVANPNGRTQASRDLRTVKE